MSDAGWPDRPLEVTMKHVTKPMRRLAASIAVLLLLTACTPIQLAVWQQESGVTLGAGDHERLVALPDDPMRLPDGAQVHPDGTVTRDPSAFVNSLPYSYQSKEPVMTAFRAVAAWRGWTPEQIASWETAVWDIALKEAQGCWNVRYGARFKYWDGRNCELSRVGRGAAGYGQITTVALGAPCRRVNICTQAEIVASPWNSMLALVALIEESGVRPWCYDSFSRKFHRVACNNPGLDVP